MRARFRRFWHFLHEYCIQGLWKYGLSSRMLWLIPLCISVLVLAVEARTGGGNRYSGGGRSGGGGGGGIGDLIMLLIWLCIRFPLLGIPIAIIVLFVMYKGGRNAQTFNEGRVIRKGRQKQEAYSRNTALDILV